MCLEVSETFKVIDKWFDLFNTQVPHTTKCLAYGLDLETQDKILHEMDQLMSTMHVHQTKNFPRKTLMPFQKGILMSNNSLRNLFSDIRIKYNVKYIITRHLNQDVLENCFSYLRGMGAANTHPTPLNFKYRLN